MIERRFAVLLSIALALLVVWSAALSEIVPDAPLSQFDPWLGVLLGVVLVPVMWFFGRQYGKRGGTDLVCDILTLVSILLTIAGGAVWAFSMSMLIGWLSGIGAGVLSLLGYLIVFFTAEHLAHGRLSSEKSQ